MFTQEWFAQHSATGAIGRTLDGVAALASLPRYTQFRAAVAYATLNGCRVLDRRLQETPRWARCPKRWLISIDYGRTEPSALEFLAELRGADVRIPVGAEVVKRAGFSPSIPFHPKVYTVDDFRDGRNSVLGIFLGSGNLTSSGLLTGTESGGLSCWVDATRSQKSAMISAYGNLSWFDKAWETADPVANVIAAYKKLWVKPKRPPEEENLKIADLVLGGPDREVAGGAALSFATAKALWVEVRELYKNRGPHEAGNQVDLRRGSRVFFGFEPNAVPRNTVFGHVMLQNIGFHPIECSVRFGNNFMDKVNLPVPGVEGPISYDNSMLLFERHGLNANGLPQFQVRVGKDKELKRWKRDAISEIEWRMQGGRLDGRRYGLLF